MSPGCERERRPRRSRFASGALLLAAPQRKTHALRTTKTNAPFDGFVLVVNTGSETITWVRSPELATTCHVELADC